MKALKYFLLLSITLHLLLFFINVKQSGHKEDIVPVEILRQTKPDKPAVEIQPEQDTPDTPVNPPAEVIPPKGIIPNTPPPESSVPVLAAEEPNTTAPAQQAPVAIPEPEATEKEPPPAGMRAPIIPQAPDPNHPPPPMSLDEFLNESAKQTEAQGPDRSMKDIFKDFVESQVSTEGEDSVSFNKMSFKYDSYFYAFSRSLYGVWRYPEDAARRGESGIVRVTFSVMKDGTITNISLLESSGYPALDREVLRTLRTMSGVALPDSLNLEVMHVNGYFIYSLDGRYRVY